MSVGEAWGDRSRHEHSRNAAAVFTFHAMLRLLLLSLAIAGWSHLVRAQDATHGDVAPPALVALRLSEATTRYRLVPRDHQQPDTTTWTVSRRPASASNRRIELQIMVATSHGHHSVDTVGYDMRTLRVVWEHLHAGTSTLVEFDGAQVIGDSIGSNSTHRRFHLTTPGFAYSSTMDNAVVQRLPLRPGYVIALPFWDGDHLEIDTVRVRHPGQTGRSQDGTKTWVVELAEPWAIETLFIDRQSRRIVRHVYTWRRDGSYSDVITGR